MRGAGGGKVKGGGRNLVRDAISTGGSRFLSAEREQELRSSLERRGSNASSVPEVLMEDLEEGEGSMRHEGQEENRNVGEAAGQDRLITIGERLNELDIGAKLTEISERLRVGVRGIMATLEDPGADLEAVKKSTKEGLVALVEGLEAVMGGISDGVRSERVAREEEGRRVEHRMDALEASERENKAALEAMRQSRDRVARKESAQILTEKLRQADRQLKYLDVDFGRATNSRREIVEKAISYLWGS